MYWVLLETKKAYPQASANLADNIIKFPGFIVLADRNTIQKDGKRYKNTKAMIADLSYQDCKRTYEWRIRCYMRLRGWQSGPEDRHAANVLDTRARMLRMALHGDTPHKQGDVA